MISYLARGVFIGDSLWVVPRGDVCIGHVESDAHDYDASIPNPIAIGVTDK